MRRYREPSPVLFGPAVGVAACCGLAVGHRVARAGMDDGEVAHDANLDLAGFEISDGNRYGGLLQEARAVDQRLVRIAAVEIRRQDFLETLHIAILYGSDIVAVQRGQLLDILAHGPSFHISVIPGRERSELTRNPERST